MQIKFFLPRPFLDSENFRENDVDFLGVKIRNKNFVQKEKLVHIGDREADIYELFN